MTITARAPAEAKAIRIGAVSAASAKSIEIVNKASTAGGESYFRYWQIEMLSIIAPQIAAALAEDRLVTGNEDGGPTNGAANQIVSVIQTVLAAQSLLLGDTNESTKKGHPELLTIEDLWHLRAGRFP